MILIGREPLRTPSFARQAARELGADVHIPQQYPRSVKTTGR